MSRCAVKRGIVALRDCGADAVDTCTSCARPVCVEHMKVRSGSVLCVECYARSEETAGADAQGKKMVAGKGQVSRTPRERSTSGDDWDDPTWPYTYRHHYYTTSHYTPFYTGSYYDTYYDDYDVRSFEGESTDMAGMEDDTSAGGFYDS